MRHRLIGRQTRKLRHQHEMIALRAQPIDDGRQRRDRLRAISSGIMEQNDIGQLTLRRVIDLEEC